ncbi:hypothetical protein [Ehrlichia canis]|uniref:Uncharacterized protein n=1 Tax=Ehrlichia canis (strain Jake) TaxID=269484 RepID=A0ACA6AVM6_EHRCJ|nr:hypothetical protein [Ehrlichia canis]AAZ68387.1 hypothetical protein Ecaj_0344 [Ehrlichia canis str. Jake]AUO54856.1 hypothetical protein C1I72_03115 [Ehrlichia canis]UKC53026.1 hypothetical protein s20019040002_000068 [Ehrlichia canis]UKC53963.1 hypothetical protein s20026770001_000068 [Ehrlichia canis]UKC54899.1 hypothetical protein s21009500007_000068 [Ehrlichia canis]
MKSSIFNKHVTFGILSVGVVCFCAVLINEYSKNSISFVTFAALMSLCLALLLASALLCYGLGSRLVDDSKRAIDFLPCKSGSFIPYRLEPRFHDVSSMSLHVYDDLCNISQDLKLLVSQPSKMTHNDFYNPASDRCCLLFLNFRRCFDSMLDKLECGNVFIKEDHINIVDVERLLTQEDRTFVILAAQLIVRNRVLYSTYPEAVYEKILKLANLSVKEVPFQERLNAGNRIIKLLEDKVYSFSNEGCFHKFLENIFHEYMSFKDAHVINSPSDFYKMRDHDMKLKLLKDVFCASYFKYYSIYQDKQHDMVRRGVDFASCIIQHYDESATRYDSDIVQYLNEMRKSGFVVDAGISNASIILNAREIISKVFEQTAVMDNGYVSCFSRYSFEKLSTVKNSAMKMVQGLASSEFGNNIIEKLDACALVYHMTLSTSPYNRMFISQRLTTSVNKEELIFNIYHSLYHYANVVKKVSNSIDNFRAYEAVSTNIQDEEYYILYPLLKSVLDTGLSILHTKIKPGSPISQDDVYKIFSSYDVSKRILSHNRRKNIFEEIVCCARVTCCLPHLLKTYPDDVVNHIKALANFDIGENKYHCVEYLSHCYDICVFSNVDEFQQMMNSFLASYSSYYQSLDERLKRKYTSFQSGSSFDIVLMHLRYTSLYNSEMVEQHLIDDACDRMKSLDFDRLRNFYMSFMQVIANTMNFGHDQIYFPLYEVNTLQNDVENDVVSDKDTVCESMLCHSLPSTSVGGTCGLDSGSAIAH